MRRRTRTERPHATPGQRARAARNLAVAAAVASGMSVRQVAGHFGISPTRAHEIFRQLAPAGPGPGPGPEKPNTRRNSSPGPVTVCVNACA